MTEERFNLAYETNDQYCIWWAVRDGDITLWKEEVVSLLNSLNEENEKLKQLNIPIDKIKETVKDCKGRIIGIYYTDENGEIE